MSWLPDSFSVYNLRKLNVDYGWEERLKKDDENCEEKKLRMMYGNKKVGKDWKKFKRRIYNETISEEGY